MKYTYTLEVSTQEHDDFVKKSDQTNLFQSSSWAKIKDNWGNERIGFYKDGQLVASASILIRPLPLGFSMLYIPRGPIMDYTNKELVSFVLKTLKKFGRSKRALFVKFDPYILLSHRQIDQEPITNTQAQAIVANLQEAGCEWFGLTTDMAENIQPRFQANILKEYFSDDQLSKSTKQAVRTSLNKGVQVSFGHLEFLDQFSELMKKTENRKSISLRGREYYKKLLETYPDSSYITLAQLDLEKRQEALLFQKQKLEEEMAKFTEKTKASKVKNHQQELDRILDELTFLEPKLQTGQKTVSLAGTLTIVFEQASENLYAGLDEEFRRYQPAIVTWYETAKHSFSRGAIYHNMGGIENNLDGGLFNYKSKFNPVIEEFIGEFNLPVNTLLYKLSSKLYTLRKQLRNKN
ncbi:aminoacyltransferase [Streptococcus suis]|uniref:aminoacyltransferase n=1 Tax=Streptococcus suis TaxID=1307 RepID=UPI002117832A|nr:aminoacyltransferase [Streptococcus suis]